MSKAPAMPMYWDAYLADTTHLTTEEHGAYLLLLAAMWRRNGEVPDDDRDNARILGLTPAKWRKVKARLTATIDGLSVENGTISQKNLRKIWENTQEKIEKNRQNGAKGGRPKSSKNSGIAKANGSVSVNPNKSIPEPEPEPEDKILRICVDHSTRDRFFADFWEAFPHRGGVKKDRKKAKAIWDRIDKSGKHDLARIVERARAYRGDGAVLEGYGKGPVPWLNGQCWEDEIEPPRRAAKKAPTGGAGGGGDGFEEAFKRRHGLT